MFSKRWGIAPSGRGALRRTGSERGEYQPLSFWLVAFIQPVALRLKWSAYRRGLIRTGSEKRTYQSQTSTTSLIHQSYLLAIAYLGEYQRDSSRLASSPTTYHYLHQTGYL